MIHGDRQARAAVQSRAFVLLAIAIAAFAAVALAAGVATVDVRFPAKTVASFAVVAVVLAVYKLRETR